MVVDDYFSFFPASVHLGRAALVHLGTDYWVKAPLPAGHGLLSPPKQTNQGAGSKAGSGLASLKPPTTSPSSVRMFEQVFCCACVRACVHAISTWGLFFCARMRVFFVSKSSLITNTVLGVLSWFWYVQQPGQSPSIHFTTRLFPACTCTSTLSHPPSPSTCPLIHIFFSFLSKFNLFLPLFPPSRQISNLT